jgi:hypothetical protein
MKPALVFVVGILMSACGTVPAECELPWDSMEQLRRCVSQEYDVIEASEDLVNIRVSSRHPSVIAGALAHAFLEMRGGTIGEVAVWAWPPPERLPRLSGRMLIRDHSGYVAEFHEGTLHFEICTSWEEVVGGPGEFCDDQIEYEVPR